MHDDPFETRERGLRRVHTVTASVAAATLLGTGVIVYELAAPASAAADQQTQTGTDGGQQVQPPTQGDDGATTVRPPAQNPVQPPARPPAPAPRVHPHASSGGS